MLKAFLIRKGLQIAIPIVASTVIPFVVYDRPRIKWVWDHVGPRIVETATEALEADEVDGGRTRVKFPGGFVDVTS